ncbi:site-specific integrase [Snodgrassella sp. B3088]|nr:site-specific integrase [Snodgrassella sp. B3088]MCX8748632.1 site-specific integrase [Snodgrassella sp. B3088]
MSLYKRESGIWYYDIILPNGQRSRGSTRTKDKTQAEELHDKLKYASWRQFSFGEKPKVLWDEAALKWIKSNEDRKKSIDDDISRLRQLPELRGVYLHEINKKMIMSIVDAKNCSDSTKNRYLALIRSILNVCVDKWEILDKKITLKSYAESPPRVKWIRPEEANALITYLERYPYMAAITKFDLATGLRQANVFGLKWPQIDFKRRICEYYPEDMKANKPLVIPLNDTAMKVLTRQMGMHEKFVFVHSRHKQIKRLNYKWWDEAKCETNIDEDFNWHDLRHTWASWLVQNGVSLYALKELGGWQTLEMVQRYAHLAPEHLIKDALKIDNIMTTSCHNLDTPYDTGKEVVTVEMMRKILKDLEEKWWVVSDSNARPTD